jgi:hypothetical protein
MSMDTALAEASGEEIVLYFDIESDGLDAKTFGNALISFDELYRAINGVLNPGVEIEIEFIRSDQGSIRAILKSLKKDSKTLLDSPLLYIIFPFLLAVLANNVTSTDIRIIINDDSYIVEHGSRQIVLPRGAEEKARHAERDLSVRRSMGEFFAVVESDPNVKAVDFRSSVAPDEPVIPITREQFGVLRNLSALKETELPRHKDEIYYRQTVVVITAVLEKSRRKWQFLWKGQKIWADIRDDTFFDKLIIHDYEFGQGDTLVVDLVAKQELNEFVKAYETKNYYISKVHSHSKGQKQPSML